MRNITSGKAAGSVKDTDWRLGLLWPPTPVMRERNHLRHRRLSMEPMHPGRLGPEHPAKG